MTTSLLSRTARGAGWVMAWRLGMRVLGLVSTLVLVRLLAPADFGLIALASGFMHTVDGLMSLGTEEAVIRTRAPDRGIYDTAFTLTALRGLFASLLVGAIAYPAARFFNDPRLGPVLMVIALLPLLDGCANIGAVDFRRDMTFHKEFALMVLPKFCGIIAAILAALLTHSFVAMLCGMLVNRGLRMVMTYVMHPFRPRLSLQRWRALVGYSAWSWVLSLAVLLRERCDSLILGRLADPAALGLYSVGAEIAALPTTELVEPLGRAAFAGFASEQHTEAEVCAAFPRLIGFVALLALPAGLGLSSLAAPLVRVALGSEWDAAVPVLQVLALAGTATVFGHLSLHLLSARARLGQLVGVTCAGAALRVGLLLTLIPAFGVFGAAAAAGLAIIVEQGLTVGLALRQLGVGGTALLVQIWRPTMASAAMALVLWMIGYGWAPMRAGDGFFALVSGVGIGTLVFTGGVLALWLVAGRPAGAEADFLNFLRRR